LVEQAAAAIVDTCNSNMSATDRILKMRYILSFCRASTDVWPCDMQEFLERFDALDYRKRAPNVVR
jgi:hypothetical protein